MNGRDRLQQLIEQNRWELALSELRAAREEDDIPLELRGIILSRNQRHVEAVKALEAASQVSPLCVEASIRLAESYAATNRTDLAVWIYKDLAASEEAVREHLHEVACGLGRCGESVAALELCQSLLEKSPDCPKAAFGVAYYMNRLGRDSEEILPYLRRAVQGAPDITMFRLGLAFCLDRMGRSYEAYDNVKTIEMCDVHWPHCLHRLAEIFLTVNDRPRFIACQARLRQLTNEDPGSSSCVR